MMSTLDLSELEEKVGGLFMAGMPGPELDSKTEALIRAHHLGGIIFFSRNVESPLQVARLCRELQETAMKHRGSPLFLAVDQEGGRVARLVDPFTRFPGNEAIGNDPDPAAQATTFATVTAREMALVGLNMDFAPVVDVRRGEPERHLSGRMFGDDPEKVGRLGGIVVRTLQANGVMAVAKHFPGLGRAELDPHYRLPAIDADAKEMEAIDLVPFKAAIEADVSAIMTSHAVYPGLDPDRPATLSEKILTDLLRKRMGYKGLLVTDDLEMGAISENGSVSEGAAASFEAGADILLICKDQEEVLEAMEMLKGRLLRGEIPLERLLRSAERIAQAKSRRLKAAPVDLERVKAYFDKGWQRVESRGS